MVLHGLEGSTRAHSILSGDGGAHSAFPFAPGILQPPLISVLRNVKYCTESFRRRQQDESRCEFHLKARDRHLETIKVVFDQVGKILDGCGGDG